MRILAFDLSSHTGWAVMDQDSLIKSGNFDVKISDWKSDVHRSDQFSPKFPGNFATAVQEIVTKCSALVEEWKPDLVVTEFIEGSSRRFSQMFLDWLHYEFYRELSSKGQPYRYILNSDWRNFCKCWISQHPEHIKFNAKIGRLKRQAKPTKSGAKVAKIDGKVVSRIDAKKLSIMIAQDHFGIKLDSDDEADAINQCRAAQHMWGVVRPSHPA